MPTFQKNKITQLFGIKYPIIQGGMVWVSGWRLVSAVSNAGGLGLLGAGSMYPSVLEEHIQKCKKATDKPFGVNVPLMYPEIDKIMDTIVQQGVQIVFTSAGDPQKWTSFLKAKGITVVHVVSSVKFALKAVRAEVDAVVCEGFEAGGHNGREETTSFTLIPMVKAALALPVIAAGGIATGRGMLAAMVLGADGVQIGSRFAVTEESSAHSHFKQAILKAKEGDTHLTLKSLAPVRMLKNPFYEQIRKLTEQNPNPIQLKKLVGKARAKKGIFEGDLEEGKLEIGQVAALIREIKTAKEVLDSIIEEFDNVKNLKFD